MGGRGSRRQGQKSAPLDFGDNKGLGGKAALKCGNELGQAHGGEPLEVFNAKVGGLGEGGEGAKILAIFNRVVKGGAAASVLLVRRKWDMGA